MSALDIKLNTLLHSGREYTLRELYKFTGEDGHRGLKYETFRQKVRNNPLYECYYNADRELWLWKVTKILLPSPVELKKEFKKWLLRQKSKLTKS